MIDDNKNHTHIGPETVLRLHTEPILAGILLLSAVPTRGLPLWVMSCSRGNTEGQLPFRSGTRKRVGKEKIDIIMHRDHFFLRGSRRRELTDTVR